MRSPKKKRVLFQKRKTKKEKNQFIIYSVFKKKIDLENMKKTALKSRLLIIGPLYFLSTGPTAQTTHKQKSCTTKSPLMQDWVFRLG